MAMISLNLGLLNLMPIPVLDGGHVFIMLLEGIARRDFSVRMKGEDAPRRFRRPDDADGDGDLQRPHACSMDRADDSVEMIPGSA